MSCPVRVRESLVDFGNGDTGDDSPCEIAQDRLSDHSDSANSMERSAHEAKQSARVVGDGKRKRQPRTRFVEWQLRLLINSFRVNPLPDRGELADIAAATRLSINVVRVWFQNRRRNEKVAGTRHATSPVHKTYGQVPTFHFLNPLQGPTATSGVYDLAMSASNQGQLYLPKPATEVIGGLRYQSAPLQAVDQTTQAIYIPAAAYGTSTSTLLACPATESTSSIAVGTTSKLMMASSPSKTHFYSGSKARAEKYSTDGDEYVDSDETSAQFATSPAFHILPTKVKTPVSPENLQIDSEGFDNQVECNSEGSLKQAANNCEQGLADSPQLPPLLSSACQGTGPSSIGGKLHSPSPMNLSSEVSMHV